MSLRRALIAFLLVTWFLGWAHPGLFAYFSADDMMNLYSGWQPSWAHHLRESVLFFTGGLRPLGNLFYKATFAAFDLAPMPYRVVCFGLLLANLWLTYAVARHVSGRTSAAFLSTLIAAYHAPLAGIYHSTAVVYDILAYLFFFAAFLVAARRRSLAACCVLFVCALDSKEIAVVLPAVLAAYEWFCGAPRQWKWTMSTGAVAALWWAGKLFSPQSMLANPAYRPSLSPPVMIETLRHYLRLLSSLAWDWPLWSMGVLALAMVLLAWWSRLGAARWAAALIVFATVPLLTIEPRSFYALYIAWAGWAIFLGSLLTLLPKPWIVTAAVAGCLVPLHVWATPRMMGDVRMSQAEVRPVLEQVKALNLQVPRGGRVLFLADPYPTDDWILTFIVLLITKDPAITVDRTKRLDSPPTAADLETYQYVLRIDGDKRVTRLR